jgi:Flp pilus assembly protein CpaB
MKDKVRVALLMVVIVCMGVIGVFAFNRVHAAPTNAEKQQVMTYLQTACEVASYPGKQVTYHNWKVQELVTGAVTTGYIVTTDKATCTTSVDADGHVIDSKVEF